MNSKKKNKYLGYLGFMGFLGFQYFTNHNVATLSCFAYFGFFGYFFINKIANDMVDERFVENSRRAKAFTFYVALAEFVLLYLSTSLQLMSKEIFTVAIAFCFAIIIITYSIAFYRFEKI